MVSSRRRFQDTLSNTHNRAINVSSITYEYKKWGRYLFLEFPDRYYRVELHTNMPSVEFMPLVIRSLLLRYRSSRFSKLNPPHRLCSWHILDEIHPMSVWRVKIFLFLNSLKGRKGKVEHWYLQHPGMCRW
jgi:hypothetical protein